MRQLLAELTQSLQAGRPCVFCSVVETRGSTPQKAGAAMLVFPDGSQAGTLGGGCVEAEVKRRALRLLDSGETELLTFQLDDNYGWDDGLVCGGRMKMLVDPARQADDLAYVETVNRLLAAGAACTEAVVIEGEKAGGGAAGDRLLVNALGEAVAARAKSAAPQGVLAHLRPVGQRPRPYVE